MSGVLPELLSLSLPMTALILLLGLFSRIAGNRFTAKCRYIIWTVVLLRLCLPFGLLNLPSLVQINIAPETAAEETSAKPSPTLVWQSSNPEDAPLKEGVTYYMEDPVAVYIDETDPEKLDEILTDTLKALTWDLELPEGVETEIISKTEPIREAAAETTTESPAEPSPAPETEPETTAEPVPEPVTEISVTEEPSEPASAPAAPAFPDILTVLGIVWLLGAVVYAARKIVSYNLYAARIRKTTSDAAPHIRHIYGRLCEKYGIRRPPELRVSPDIHSPLLFGFFRPCVLLPEMQLSDNQAAAILAHELTHYRRHDLWVKLACVLGCALHWFNPAAHFAVSRCHAEMELSCDEAVLAGLDEEARRSYGNVMLDILRLCSRNNLSLTTHFNPKKEAVRERFLNIMDMSKKKRGFAAVTAAAILCSLSGMVFAYDTEAPAEDENTIKVNDRVSIRLGFGALGKYEELKPDENDPAEPEEISEPVKELYERGGLEIPVLSEMVEYVTVPAQTEDGLLIEYYQNASLTDGKVDRESGTGFLFGIGRHTYAELVRDRYNTGGLRYFAAEPDNSWFYYIASPTDVRWTTLEVGEEYAELAAFDDSIAERVLTDNGLTPFTGQDIPDISLLSAGNTYPSPDYLSRLEYSKAYGWILRGEGAGANGIAIGDFTKNAEVWAEWISPDCCRLAVKQASVIDLFRTESGWTTEPSAFELTLENHLPVWAKNADFTDTGDILRKAYYGMLKPDEFLTETQIKAKFIKRTAVFVEPYRSGDTYVPDGAVFPERITWDTMTVTASGSDDYDYLITLPLGEFYMTIKAEIVLSETGVYHLELSGEEFHLTDPIVAEEGLLRDLLESLMQKNRTDYSAEIHIPDADNAVLSIKVEGEGRDLHDLKDIFCTEFTANGQTIRFAEPLDLWGAWGTYVFAAENTVVLMQKFTEDSGNSYVITPKYTYEYHPGVFSLVLYEENDDLRYRHSSSLLCDAAMRTGDDLSASLLGIATSRDNFYYECGDVVLNGGKLMFSEADEYYTIGDAFDLDAEFEKQWKSAAYPTLDDLFLRNVELYGGMYDYPTPDETPLPETVKVSSLYQKVEAIGTYTSEYRLDITTDSTEGVKLSSSIHIPQLTAGNAAVSKWNSALFSQISRDYEDLLKEYQTPGTADRWVTVTYEEIVHDGVVSLPITFTEYTMNTEIAKRSTTARVEVYHYDTEADKFLTNEEYLIRLTDGKFDYETLLEALNEQEFNRVMNEPHAHLLPGHEVGPFTLSDICGILPSELDENSFDVYLPLNNDYNVSGFNESIAAVHWREYPVFTAEEGYWITYRLLRQSGGYRMLTYIEDTRDLPLPEENQGYRIIGKLYTGNLFELTYSERLDYAGDSISAEITCLNGKGETFTQTTSYGTYTAAETYFKKYLEGTYSMQLLMDHALMVQNRSSSFVKNILKTYHNGEKPLADAPDVPKGLTLPEQFTGITAADCFVETGDPAHPFKFAVPLDGSWTMDVYWHISEDFKMTVDKIEFRQ